MIVKMMYHAKIVNGNIIYVSANVHVRSFDLLIHSSVFVLHIKLVHAANLAKLIPKEVRGRPFRFEINFTVVERTY